MTKHIPSQKEFSGVLFDTLFGLVLFFSLESFLDIHDPFHFVFYLSSLIIVVHWWLIFKSADDCFGDEVSHSITDIVFGIVYLIFIQYIVFMSRAFSYEQTTIFLLLLLGVDMVWTLLWKYVGSWSTIDEQKIARMEKELNATIRIDVVVAVLFASLLFFGGILPIQGFVVAYILLYAFFIGLTMKHKIIDIHIF